MRNQERRVELGEQTKGRFSSEVAKAKRVSLPVEKRVDVPLLLCIR